MIARFARFPQCLARRLHGPGARDDGQDLIEYALLIMLIAIVVVAAVRLLGGPVSALYQQVVDEWPS